MNLTENVEKLLFGHSCISAVIFAGVRTASSEIAKELLLISVILPNPWSSSISSLMTMEVLEVLPLDREWRRDPRDKVLECRECRSNSSAMKPYDLCAILSDDLLDLVLIETMVDEDLSAETSLWSSLLSNFLKYGAGGVSPIAPGTPGVVVDTANFNLKVLKKIGKFQQ